MPFAKDVQPDLQIMLQRVWGYSEFRPPQGEIIQTLLEGRDALIVMPTGGGKSICFQLPALVQSGLTLVVSPLVALMENQVQELRDRGLSHPVGVLHSQLPSHQRKQTLQRLEHHQLKLLYLSPETLLSPPVWQRLCAPDLAIVGLILDEAHCLVQWGETFRPAYYRLGAVRAGLLQHKPTDHRIAIAAFTATADPQAQATIAEILRLENPQRFSLNPYRANLHLSVQTVWTAAQRRHQLLQFVRSHSPHSGLIYVRSRQDSETLAAWFRQCGFTTCAYHAGLSSRDRRQIEQAWLTNQHQFVVSTNAFGMGVNKPDLRWVAHFHAPHLLSEYVQEVGRAGRDGRPANSLTLVSEPTGWLDSTDRQRQRFFQEHQQNQYRLAQTLMPRLPQTGDLQGASPDQAIALSLLQSVNALEWVDPFHYQRLPLRGSLKHWGQSNLEAARDMTRFLYDRRCRWQYLLAAFGFAEDAAGWQCGHCDRCCRRR